MVRAIRLVFHRFAAGALAGALLLAFGGCSGSASPKQRVESELTKIGQSTKSVFPFAGKVQIDGQLPQVSVTNQRVVVVLFDKAKPTLGVAERPSAICNARGEFSFTTYNDADGVEPADYVITFALLCLRAKDGSLVGPDGLQNLYNDPEKNEKIDGFTIKHASPGKRDYIFNLKEAGQEAGTAVPRAVTEIINR
jgi:hypothetical protein